MNDQDKHWLVRTKTIRWLWIIGGVILAATLVANIFIPIKGYFGIDGTLGFFAWFGFGCCFLMVVFAKGLGFLIKRPDDYYDDR